MSAPDSSDLLLIRCLQEHPRASYAVIARLTGMSETTARRRVEEMVASRLVTPAAIPDLHRLGYAASAYLGLKVDLVQLERIATALVAMPLVTFAVTTTGRYDLIVSVAQRTLSELSRFLADEVASLDGVLSVDTMVAPKLIKGLSKDWRVPVDAVAVTALGVASATRRAPNTGSGRLADRNDLRLMRQLQDQPRASLATIARRLGLSETTVRRRIEALTQSGVMAFAVVPDLNKLGYDALAFVGLKVDVARLYEIADQLVPIPEIAFVANTTGRFDLLIFVVQRTLGDLMRFIVERVAPLPGIQRAEILIAPTVLKVLGDWRIPEGEPACDAQVAS
jgi:Lrp/AsnC family transcriptional regulator for asnA, asnC and gidA